MEYVLAFHPSFIEIWRCDGESGVDMPASLVQIIPGRDIRMIGKQDRTTDGSSGYCDRVLVAMRHPELVDRQMVFELSIRKF